MAVLSGSANTSPGSTMRTIKSGGGSFLTSRGAYWLLALPLVLAAFALGLQWSTHTRIEQQRQNGFPGDRILYENPGGLRTLEATEDGWIPKNEGSTQGWRPGGGFRPAENLGKGPRLAFVTTTADTLRQIRLWIQYHRAVGVTDFILFVEGQAAKPEVANALDRIEGVQVVIRDEALKQRHASSRIWNETWLSAFFHKPCNHELFVLQSLNMEAGIEIALKNKVEWILHVDTDELMYPGGAPDYSLQRILASYEDDVDTVVFPNYESLPERDDVKDPFTEVTLFKRNYHHVVPDLYFKSYHAVARGNPNYFITYGNGKSAARVQAGLRPNGAHRWYSYTKAPREETSDQAAVLHYTYNRFEDLKSRRDRCDCAPTEEDAKRCFILPFDRMAFLAASMKSDEELMGWFRERLVWNDPAVVMDLLKNGLFVRLYTPQVLEQPKPQIPVLSGLQAV
ncbi:hypothetical protein WJX84_012365 [Apatococcus fuscideae]|uniref:Glycosyltransferase family 92 protein n=1 Tax=Apatococcus fuscideae TaxID=2026836 RepID=A0AAW1SUS9_9CHLO